MTTTNNRGDKNVLDSTVDKLKNLDYFSTNNSTISEFLSKSSKDIMSEIIDPLNTFDVEFKFSPSLFSDDGTSIYGYKNWHYDNSFLKDLAIKLLNVGKQSEKVFESTLTLQMGYYIQSMSLPHMTMPEAGKVQTLIGEFPVNNIFVKADNNQFQMSILNTKLSLHDYIFYPWMREVSMPFWSYEKQPYTTATVTVKFDKHCNSRYVFCGCRPSQVLSRQPTQEPEGTVSRDVTMIFDYMYITNTENDSYTIDLQVLENAYKDFESIEKVKNTLGLTI